MNAKEAAEITLKVMREKASKDMALATMLMADVERRIANQKYGEFPNAALDVNCDTAGVANAVRDIAVENGFSTKVMSQERGFSNMGEEPSPPRFTVRISWELELRKIAEAEEA